MLWLAEEGPLRRQPHAVTWSRRTKMLSMFKCCSDSGLCRFWANPKGPQDPIVGYLGLG